MQVFIVTKVSTQPTTFSNLLNGRAFVVVSPQHEVYHKRLWFKLREDRVQELADSNISVRPSSKWEIREVTLVVDYQE